jgi:hypothetical protein
MKIRCDGRETVIPEGVVGDQESIQNCIPLGKDVYLLRIMNPDIPEFRAVCVDHGEEEYRIWLAPQVYFQAPDGNGGFFCPDDWPEGDYSPEILRHYGTDGQIDRSLEIGGNKVVIRFFGSTVDPDNRLCTLYGSAVANSRKVYTVFALTLDENMNMRSLDVRKIDPAYRDYSPDVYLAQDGTAYVLINDMKNKPTLRPVLIPFSQMEKSRDDYGIYVSVIR